MISVFSEVLQSTDIDAAPMMADTAHSTEPRPENKATQAAKMEKPKLKPVVNEDEEHCSTSLVSKTDLKKSHRNRSFPLENQENLDENVRDELNNSNSDSTTRVLSKALNTLVSQDLDTVTPPRKAKAKTPVKKKTNLFRPYDLDDRKKDVPTQSPMLLRANYGSKSHSNSWQIEKRSKTETVMPSLQNIGNVISEKKSKTESDNENPLSSTRTDKVQDKGSLGEIVNSNLLGMHTVRDHSQSKSDMVYSVTCQPQPPLLASTPKRAPNLPAVIHAHSSSERNTEINAQQSKLKKDVINNRESDEADSTLTIPRPREVVDRFPAPTSTNQGQLPNTSASNQLDNMCQKISAVMGKLAEGFRIQKHIKILGQRAPNQIPTIAHTARQSVPNQTPTTTVSEPPRPGSCPPTMMNPNSAAVNSSQEEDNILSRSRLESAGSMKHSWAKHHSANAGILSTSKAEKTVLPSFATFSNKQFQPKQFREARDKQFQPNQSNKDCALSKESLPQHMALPAPVRYPKALSSQVGEMASNIVKTEIKDPSSIDQGTFLGQKRPLSLPISDTYVRENKIPRRHPSDSNAVYVHAQYMDKDGQAMRIPLRPPLPSPQTGVADSYRSSHRHLAGNFLPYSVPSSQVNKTFTAHFQSNQVYTSSHNMHNVFAKYSDRKSFDNENSVENVKKKLDLNLDSEKANNVRTDSNQSSQRVKDNAVYTNDSLRLDGRKSHKFSGYVQEKNIKNLQERVVTNSEETKSVDYPKYIMSNSQSSAFDEIHPRYDRENMTSYGFMSKVDKHNTFPPPILSRRPLGVSVLQNQMLGPNQRHHPPPMESPVPDSRPKPFSVLRPQELAFPAESQPPTQPFLHSEVVMHSVTNPFVHRPFTAPVRPVGPPPFSPVPTLRPPTPTFGPQYHPTAGQIEPLSPVPVAEKLPMAALLLMMKVIMTVFSCK